MLRYVLWYALVQLHNSPPGELSMAGLTETTPQRIIPDLRIKRSNLINARAGLARRDILAYTVLQDGRAYTLTAKGTSLDERTATLRAIVNTYKERAILNRISTDRLSQARKLYPDALAIIVFPHYEPAEIVVAARDGVLLPPGISRHIVNGRAMRLNYPLDAFREH